MPEAAPSRGKPKAAPGLATLMEAASGLTARPLRRVSLVASLRLQGDRERDEIEIEIEIEIEMREKERREEGVDWMCGREKEDKEREEGASGLGDGARLFSLRWCLHPVLKGPLFVSSGNTTRD
jgi:hypothetical protein